ncbi:MAG: hypothetical protein E2O92_03290 [Alphaproteobacteria bacterium]|nr:MAG: hypothetical protein E2O92_03290 [Alphaproteobacteria bacterium]
MSHSFGPIVQQGYVVPDLDVALSHWVARGIGPFFVLPDHHLETEYYGTPAKIRIKAAFAASGTQQIELIEPYADSGPTVYQDYLDSHPEGGLQHVAVWCEDVPAQIERMDDADWVLAQRYKGTHAYYDHIRSPGVMIQFMPTLDRYLSLFKTAEREADNWDGATDPVRNLDW